MHQPSTYDDGIGDSITLRYISYLSQLANVKGDFVEDIATLTEN